MLHNYHTHTFRNHHAVGTGRELYRGCDRGRLSDARLFRARAISSFQTALSPYFHMFPEDLEDYIQTLLALKAEYAGRIEILIGYEAEYYPRFLTIFLPASRSIRSTICCWAALYP